MVYSFLFFNPVVPYKTQAFNSEAKNLQEILNLNNH